GRPQGLRRAAADGADRLGRGDRAAGGLPRFGRILLHHRPCPCDRRRLVECLRRLAWCFDPPRGAGLDERKESEMRVGIIGGTGWLGGALGRALVDKGLAEVALLNRSGPQDYGGRSVRWAVDPADLVALSDVIVISRSEEHTSELQSRE